MADFDPDSPAFRPEEAAGGDYAADDPTDLEINNIIDDSAPLVPPDINAGAGIGYDTGVPTTEFTQRQRVLRTAVDDFYDRWEKKDVIPQLRRDYNNFEYKGGTLRLKSNPNLDIINSRTGEPLALSTIAKKEGGLYAIRNELGFPDWGYKSEPRVTPEDVAALNKTDERLGNVENELSDSTELKTIVDGANDATSALEELEAELNDGTDETDDGLQFSLRELRALDKALRRIRGELVNNLSKLTVVEERIALKKEKLKTEGISEDLKRAISARLRELEIERSTRVEILARNKNALRSQISRIRETIKRILHEDTTLADRVRTLFREQGITIVSILTAIGMTIGALVFALTGSGGGAATPPSKPTDKGGVKEWVKKTLQSLGRALAKLAGKAAAALPGIIGSIVSWLLSLLAKTAGWLSQNLWAVVLAIGSLLFVAAREWLLPKNPKSE